MLTLKLAAAASLAAFSLAGQAQSVATGTSSSDQQTTPAADSESATATATSLPAIRITSNRYRFTATDTALETQSATRTDTPLIEIPQSVQVVPRELIEEQDARTLADALVNVSGVMPSQPAENGFVGNIVRGFPAEIYTDGLPMYGMNAETVPLALSASSRLTCSRGQSRSCTAPASARRSVA